MMILVVLASCALAVAISLLVAWLTRPRERVCARIAFRPSRVIAFTLFGRAPRYVRGMLHNASLAPRFFPGWRVRVYCPAAGVPLRCLQRLRAMPHVDLVSVPEVAGMESKLWRFRAAFEDPVPDVCISRDCDSRCDGRDARAVRGWLADPRGRGVHIIRDHPVHFSCGRPMLAGLWGCLGGWCSDPGLREAFRLHGRPTGGGSYASDELFLMEHVYPRVREDAYVSLGRREWLLEGETLGEVLPELRDSSRHLGAVAPASRAF